MSNSKRGALRAGWQKGYGKGMSSKETVRIGDNPTEPAPLILWLPDPVQHRQAPDPIALL